MSIRHIPAFTVPAAERPQVHLPVFHDVTQLHTGTHLADLDSGAERLTNVTLDLAGEAAVHQHDGFDRLCQAIRVGKLVVELSVYDTAACKPENSKPGITITSMAGMPAEPPSWHTLLTIDGDILQISARDPKGTQASGTFTRARAGRYEPQLFEYSERLEKGPYAGTGSHVALHGLVSYRRLERAETGTGAVPVRDRFRGLAYLGEAARKLSRHLQPEPLRATAYIAIEGAGW